MSTTYKQRDLEKLSVIEAVQEAADLWSFLCAKEVAEKGDYGSCVLGAGIGIWMVPAGKRREVEYKLLDVPLTAGQGSCTWEVSMPRIISLLKEKGIEAHIIHGRLD